MRLAVLSDIHGNHIALEAVLREVEREGTDGLVFLGDYVTDFPGGHQVLAIIRACQKKFPCWLIRGNREQYMLNCRHGKTYPWKWGTETGCLYHAYHSLTEADLDFLESLPIVRKVCPDGESAFTVCHGSPIDARESIFYRDERVKECLDGIDTDLMLCGHQHLVRSFCSGKKCAVFVGSVGLPDGFGGCAQYALLTPEGGKWNVQNRVIPYDVEAALAEFESAGLNEAAPIRSRMLKIMARTGENVTAAAADRAEEYRKARGLSRPIPDAIWREVALEMGII